MFQPKEHHLKHIWHCEKLPKASAHVDIELMIMYFEHMALRSDDMSYDYDKKVLIR